MPIAAGTRLGPYEILASIGAGAMGEVYKARDTRLGRIVAVKQLKGSHGGRFEQEARAIASLNNPHVCQIHDIGPDYLVLEYIEGQPLKGPQSPVDAVRLAIEIAIALEAAHREGVIHRDLKPANILVTYEGSVKLVDFGIAKQVIDSDHTVTIEGTIVGTVAYMAPEQAQGKPLDARSDIFSFGAVLYELVSGRRAFHGDNSVSTIASILREDPPQLDAPAVLQQIVKRCLAKRPAERYQSVAELRAALESVNFDRLETSVAVLPFANLSRDADDEYFSDGLAEEIINALAQVSGLKVIARTSAFAFKGKNEDIRRIAETLGVTNVLEGSVRRAGSRLRVTVQLINAADGTPVWSQRYDRELTDVFEVQDDIAAAITEALEGKLTGESRVTRRHEPNLPAYEAFLRALHHRSKLGAEDLARAEEYYKRAIKLDPQWAEPHSMLAAHYFALGSIGLLASSDAVPAARSEARLALDLLPSEPHAHAVLGSIAALYDYDWKESKEQFRLAWASTSVPPLSRDCYAIHYLMPLGRFEEATKEYAALIAPDPLNAFWRSRNSILFQFAGLYEDAIIEAQKALEFDAANFVANGVIVRCLLYQGKLKEALERAEPAFQRAPWYQPIIPTLAALLSLSGDQARADQLVATMGSRGSIGMMLYHAAIGQFDSSIDWYEQAIEQRKGATMYAFAQFLKPLRDHPRWPKLAKMMNLPAR